MENERVEKIVHLPGVDMNICIDRSSSQQKKKDFFVWSHGLCQSIQQENKHNLFDFKEPILENSFDFLRLDHKGHGASSGSHLPHHFEWSSLAEDILNLLQKMKEETEVERVVLGGASMGCATSLYAAIKMKQKGERVDGLVLVIPPTAWQSRKAQCSSYKSVSSLITSGQREGIATAIRMTPKRCPVLKTLSSEEYDSWGGVDFILNSPFASVVFDGAALCDFPPREIIKETLQDVPILILCWTEDKIHPLSTVEELLSLLPHAQCQTAKNREDVKTWGEAISQFLKEREK